MDGAGGVTVMELTVCAGGLDTDSDPEPDPDPQAVRNAATVMTSDRVTMLRISSSLRIDAPLKITECAIVVRP